MVGTAGNSKTPSANAVAAAYVRLDENANSWRATTSGPPTADRPQHAKTKGIRHAHLCGFPQVGVWIKERAVWAGNSARRQNSSGEYRTYAH